MVTSQSKRKRLSSCPSIVSSPPKSDGGFKKPKEEAKEKTDPVRVKLLEKENATLSSKLQDLKAQQSNQLAKKSDRIDELECRVVELTGELKIAKNEGAKHQSAKENLTLKTTQMQKLNDREKEKHLGVIRSMESDQAELVRQVETLQSQNTALSRSLAEMETKLEGLRHSNRDLTGEISQIQNANSCEVKKLQDQLVSSSADLRIAQEQLFTKDAEAKRFSEQVLSAENRRKEDQFHYQEQVKLATSNAELNARLRFEESSKQTGSERHKLEEEVREQKKISKGLRREISILKDKLEGSRQEATRLTSKLDRYKNRHFPPFTSGALPTAQETPVAAAVSMKLKMVGDLQEVESFLEGLGLDSFIEVFKSNLIRSMTMLRRVTAEDLAQIVTREGTKLSTQQIKFLLSHLADFNAQPL